MAPECIADELSKIETTLRLIQAELGYYETKLSGDKENASANIVINTPDEGGAQFIKVMKPFLDEANKIFNAIQSEYKQALLRYSEALSFYAEDVDTKPHQFFAHVTNFASTIRVSTTFVLESCRSNTLSRKPPTRNHKPPQWQPINSA